MVANRLSKRFLMDTEPILTKTSDLDRRFNIGKNTRVNRLAMLGLTPDKLEKQGRFYFLSVEQVKLFADFDEHILQTGSVDGYSRLSQTFAEVTELELEDEEDLFTVDEELPGSVEPDGSLVKSSTQDLVETLPVVEAEYASNVYRADATTQLLVEKAQRRATALMLAENVLVQQYMDDPSLLKPELRAQIGSFEYREIDPKELAASLIAGAQSYMKGAA
jgi:hypothetical protein